MKNLTVQQKRYLVERVSTISSRKCTEIEKEYTGKLTKKNAYTSGTYISCDIVEAALAGNVRMLSGKGILELLREKLESHKKASGEYYQQHGGTIHFPPTDLFEKGALDTFYFEYNEQVAKYTAERNARREAVMKEATRVKDSIILEGNESAVKLLEEFSNKKF